MKLIYFIKVLHFIMLTRVQLLQSPRELITKSKPRNLGNNFN